MAVDMNAYLAGSLAAIIQQGVSDNQRLAQNTLLAYQRDLFLSGSENNGALFGALAAADRTPVVKVAPAATAVKTS
jgi:hypothetical protein